jgi:hypothetical protein
MGGKGKIREALRIAKWARVTVVDLYGDDRQTMRFSAFGVAAGGLIRRL